ncbi:MAG: hypothetical protein B7Y41_01065 [Hydrogenophilales bacterium 28-61-23]|nr:MAG: hypothetical protein B7Y41_01065 [Hydrogenophilales bacterium 28-61-23]
MVPEFGVAREGQATVATQVAGVFAQLQVGQDSLNKAASVVREVGNAVEKAGQLLDKVESSLSAIVKMYPPYPIGSPERVLLLNDLTGLRKQIDALTFPRPDAVDTVGQLLGTRGDAVTKAGDTAVTAVSSDAVKAIKDRLWEIPVLDPSVATDADVSKVLGQVKALNSSLEDFQTGMWKDVVGFVRQADSPESKSEATGVRQQIAELGKRGIGGNGYQLVQAAESK